MKALESIKNFGKKALVGGLVLSGLATGCANGERTEICEKLDNGYKVELTTLTYKLWFDSHRLSVVDSDGTKVITVYNKEKDFTNVMINSEDYVSIKEEDKEIYRIKK